MQYTYYRLIYLSMMRLGRALRRADTPSSVICLQKERSREEREYARRGGPRPRAVEGLDA